jgi:hypothetical protein
VKHFALAFYFTETTFGAYGKMCSIAFVITIIDAWTMCRITIARTICYFISSASLFKRLAIEPSDKYYNRRLLPWTGHVAQMSSTQAPRKILTSGVDNPRPRGCPQMNWGWTLKNELLSNDLSVEFVKWREMAADQNQWRDLYCSELLSMTTATPTSSRQDIWVELWYGTSSEIPDERIERTKIEKN